MKFFFFFLFLVSSSMVFSQKQIESTTIDGKEYLIYPYKFSKSNYSFDGKYVGSSTASENEIVPYSGDLPDGNYVIYYPNKSVYKRKRWFFHRRGEYVIDSTVVAAFFSMKDNKVNGLAQYYSLYSKNLLEEGNYKNDQKEGVWKKYSNEYISDDGLRRNLYVKKRKSIPFVNHYEDVIEEFNYVDGIRHGEYKKYFKKDPSLVIESGAYIDNEESGSWKKYYKNHKVKESYTYADSISPLMKHSKISIYDDYDYEYSTKYYSSKLKGNFHGWVYEYYPNGNLLKRSWYQFGHTRGLDTNYYNDGKIRSYFTVENKKQDTITNEIINYYRLDTLGKVIRQEQRINGLVAFKIKYNQGAIYEKQYYSIYYANLKYRDTLVPGLIEYTFDDYADTSTRKISKISFIHLETGIELKRKINSQTGGVYGYDDFKFSQDKTSKIYYLEEIDYNGKNNEFEYHTYKHYYRSPYYSYLDRYSYVIDSTKMFVDGQPFSGKFIEQRGYYKKKKMNKVVVKKDKVKFFTRNYGGYDYGGTPSFGYSSRFVMYQPRRRNFRRFFKGKTQATDYSNYVDGFLEGESKTLSGKHGKLLDHYNYSKGKMNGQQFGYSIQKADRWSDCKEIINPEISKKMKLTRNFRYFQNSHENYINGLEEGVFYNYHCNGRVAEKVEYKEGLRNGMVEMYNEDGILKKKANFLNNYYEGEYKEWAFGKTLRFDLSFEKGALVGEYKYYFNNGQLQHNGVLSNGYKTGDWVTYFENGEKKYVETYQLQDSSYFRFSTGSSSYSFTKNPDSYDHLKPTFYSRQYYPSGALAVEGKMLRGNRNGIWKFYDEGENLIKQINYEPGFILQTKANGKTDSILHFGYYESWYRNGKKQSEAYVLNESSKYDCYQQTQVSNQDLYYLNFWNQKEEQILNNKTGRIETYHLSTGKPESEGEMINGLQQGYWRYWDPEGKLTKVGNYKNGKETGVWMLGDLEGMHYLDDACFDITDKRTLDEMEYKKKKLKIHIIHYKKGKIIKQNSFDVNLNKTENYYYNKND